MLGLQYYYEIIEEHVTVLSHLCSIMKQSEGGKRLLLDTMKGRGSFEVWGLDLPSMLPHCLWSSVCLTHCLGFMFQSLLPGS